MIGLWIEIKPLPPLRGPISAVRFGSRLALPFSQHLAGRKGPSSLLSVLATSLHLPTVDTCWAKKGPIGDGF